VVTKHRSGCWGVTSQKKGGQARETQLIWTIGTKIFTLRKNWGGRVRRQDYSVKQNGVGGMLVGTGGGKGRNLFYGCWGA